jgi:hypothetical protein
MPLMSVFCNMAVVELIVVAFVSIAFSYAICSFIDKERNQADYL